MLLYVLHKLILIFRHFEEIRFLVCGNNLTSAVGAFAVYKLALCEKRFARNAVHSLIRAFIYIALVIKTFKNLLNGFFVIIVRCSNKFAVIRIHKVPDFLYLARNTVNILLGSYARFLCDFFNLLTMLVRSR